MPKPIRNFMVTPDPKLVAHACGARDRATPTLTGFCVGAAVRTENGDIFSGANAEIVVGHIEHAERAALSAGRLAGHTTFTAAAVVADGDTLVTPCGACRDWLNSHLPAHAPVYCHNLRDGITASFTVAELLPHAPRLDELARTTLAAEAAVLAGT